jgi:hypothetical protein
VPVVAGAGQGLPRDRVAVDLHVRAVPEVVQVLGLAPHERVPADVAGSRQGGQHAAAQARVGGRVGAHLVLDLASRRRLDVVMHAGGHANAASRGPVHQYRTALPWGLGQGDQGPVERLGDPRVLVLDLGRDLVGDQLGPDQDLDGIVDRLDLVGDGHGGPLGERHQPGRPDPHGPAGRRAPLDAAAQAARPQVEDRSCRTRWPVRTSKGSSSTSRRMSLPEVTLMIVWPTSGFP